MPQLIEIVRNIGRIPQLREQRPLEWRLSHPLPRRSADQLVWRCFLYPSPALRDRPRPVGRPRAAITVNGDGTRLLEYVDVRAKDDFPPGPDPAGTYPHPAIEGLDPKHIGRLTRELWAALDVLAAQSHSDQPDVDARRVVVEARSGIVEPGLLPYYEAICPQFWEWIGI